MFTSLTFASHVLGFGWGLHYIKAFSRLERLTVWACVVSHVATVLYCETFASQVHVKVSKSEHFRFSLLDFVNSLSAIETNTV